MSSPAYTSLLAAFACDTRIGDLPDSAVHASKRLLVDTIGCALGGVSMPSSKIIAKVIGSFGGVGEATVIGGSGKLPAPMAAHVNAHAANALDAEDTTLWAGHLSSCTVMPALAMAERCGGTGRDLIHAMAVAFDVVSRIGLSMKQITVDEAGKVQMGSVRGHGWAAFGSSVGAGCILKLDRERMLQAIGITGATAPLPSTGHWLYSPPPRPMTKYSMYGACAEAGVVAALLASEGFTGDRAILDGDNGLWRMYGSPGVDWDVLTDRMGEKWLIEETSFKLYPTCRFAHPIIDMIYELQAQHAFETNEVERIDIGVPQSAFNLRMNESSVHNEIDSQYSIPYMAALALLGVEPGPRWHTPAMRARHDVVALSAKVSVYPHPEAAALVNSQLRDQGRAVRFPFSLAILARGKTYDRSTTFAKGDPWAGAALTDDELHKKFRTYCAEQLNAAQIDALYNIAMEIEKETSMDRLCGNLIARHSPQRG